MDAQETSTIAPEEPPAIIAPAAPAITAPPPGATRWLRALAAGLIAGALATLAMLLAMLALRVWVGVPAPPESIPDRIAPLLRIPEFFSLFDRFGGYNGLKRFGVLSILAGMIAVGIGVGLLYALLAEDSRTAEPTKPRRLGLSPVALVFIAVVVAALWLGTVAVLLPVLDANFRGLSPGPATVFTVLGLLISYLAYGVTLVLACRLLTSAAPVRSAAPVGGDLLGRRAAIALGAAVIAGVGVRASIGRLNNRAVFSYDGLQYKGVGVQPITPNDRFYAVTKNVLDPNPTKAFWRLSVGGKVNHGRTYSYDDLVALAPIEQEATLMCISNGIDAGLMSNAKWKGVPMRTLLEAAGPHTDAVAIKLNGADGYTDTIPIDKAMDPTTLVVYGMNGEPLPQRHGYPVRVIVPGMYGEKSVKWVTGIELVNHPVKGFYAQQGWGPDFVIPTRSRIDVPDGGAPLPAGVATTIRGVAFGGNRGVSRVEVSTDGGDTWHDARIDYPGTRLSWALWSADWIPPRPGMYRLTVRATDGTGALQISAFHDIAPQGARGYQQVTVSVV
ncbi:MAG: molybdopterin-dependent oxidoreductase [Thermomicrobiales bacterium]